MMKKVNWDQIAFRVKSNITEKVKQSTRLRFAEFIKLAGGATSLAHVTGVSIGLIKGVQGNKDRMISPVMAARLTQHMKGQVSDKFTREYLRPDLTQSQWERLDYLIGKNEIEPIKKSGGLDY